MTDYEDLGSRRRPTPWDGALGKECATCGAPIDKHCVFPGTNIERHMPCISRIPKVSV